MKNKTLKGFESKVIDAKRVKGGSINESSTATVSTTEGMYKSKRPGLVTYSNIV